MKLLKQIRQGESLTLGVAFIGDYDITRLQSFAVFVGETQFPSSLTLNVVKCQVKSEHTTKMKLGLNTFSISIVDTQLGNKIYEFGNIEVLPSNATISTQSVNAGFDLLIELDFSQSIIPVTNVLYDYFQGAPVVVTADSINTAITSGYDTQNSISDDDLIIGQGKRKWSYLVIKTALKNYLDGLFEPKKGSDDNYVTDAEKVKLSNLSGTNTGDQDLSGLQPKETGKGLSENDFTDADKTKLDNLETSKWENSTIANTFNDWFIPSLGELQALIDSGIAAKIDSRTSSEEPRNPLIPEEKNNTPKLKVNTDGSVTRLSIQKTSGSLVVPIRRFTFDTVTPIVGEAGQAGKVFYVDTVNKYAYECVVIGTTANAYNAGQWVSDPYDTDMPIYYGLGCSDGIGDGYNNTLLMVGANSVAGLFVNDISVNGTIDVIIPKDGKLIPESVIANYVHTDNNFTTILKNKLAGIESGAQVNAPNTVIDANYWTDKTRLENTSGTNTGDEWQDSTVEKTFDDWYLPSIGEVQKIYDNRVALGLTVVDNIASSSEAVRSGDVDEKRDFLSKHFTLGTTQSIRKSLDAEQTFAVRDFELVENANSLEIGDNGQGGVVFHFVVGSGVVKYYELIEAPVSLTDIVWAQLGTQAYTLAGTLDGIGDGKENTAKIVALQSSEVENSMAKEIASISNIKTIDVIIPKDNKQIPESIISNYVHTDNNFTTVLKNKLDSITAIFTSELKTAYDGAVSWVSNAGENIKTALGIFAGGSINKFLTEAGTFAPISVGGASSSPLYYDPTPSGIGATKTLSYIPYPAEVEAQYTLTTTEQLLTSYVYPEPIATDTIDAGNWVSKAVGRISSSSGSSFLRLEFSIYKDGVKTLLFSKSSDEINNTTFESIPGDAANGVFAVDPTGFLWVDVYGVTSGANRTLYLKIGDGNASFIQTPLRASHEGLRELNGDLSFQHFDSTSEKTTPIAADSLGLWDSITNTFKKLSLTNMLAFLQGYFVGKYVLSYAIDSALNDAEAGVKIIDNPPYNFNLIDVYLTVAGQAPTGGKFYVDVKKNGTSIFSTILTVDVGEVSSRTAEVPYVLAATPTNFITTDLLSVEIVQVGTTLAGKNPIINFIIKQN